MRRLALGLICVLVVGWTSLGGWDSWIGAHRIAAGPENETALYQNYDPERVIKNFRYEGESYGGGYGYGAVPLIKSIRQNKDFTPRFTMRSDRELDLMNALHQDILLWLRVTGANLVATHTRQMGDSRTDIFLGSLLAASQSKRRFTTRLSAAIQYPVDSMTLYLRLHWKRPGRDQKVKQGGGCQWWIESAAAIERPFAMGP